MGCVLNRRIRPLPKKNGDGDFAVMPLCCLSRSVIYITRSRRPLP
jgi:hypothetical protein